MRTFYGLWFILSVIIFQFASHADEYIIQTSSRSDLKSLSNSVGIFSVKKALIKEMNLYLVETDSLKVSSMEELKEYRGVENVLLNEKLTRRAAPNDDYYPELWSLKNQANGADVNSQKAWDISQGESGTVVAVIDGGVDYNHEDLKRNMWKNLHEIPGNGIDDDGNGYVDDVHGWNAYDSNGTVYRNDHGTHVAGIIGATGNNGIGVAGVNWNVKVLPISGSSITTSVILEAYGYVIASKKLWLKTSGEKGANIVVTNNSFGADFADCTSSNYSLWNDVYNKMGEYGILSAAATMNRGENVDETGDVPTGCNSPFIISVTNTTLENKRNIGAAYGADSIDLGAPGTDIYSTVVSGNYDYMTGTSMATPHVAGAVALMYSAASESFKESYKNRPADMALELKNIMLQTVSPNEDLKGTTLSGGKLNLGEAVKAINQY